MKVVLMIVAAFFIGAGVSFLLCRSTINRLRKRGRALRVSGGIEEKKSETMKRVVWICLGNGFAWVWCSYILAALDKMQIAEALSTTAVTEIVGVVLAYAIKSAVENLSKHNKWPDKTAASVAEITEAQTPAAEPEDAGTGDQ